MLDAGGGGGSGKNGYQIYQEVHPDDQFAGALSAGATGVKEAAKEHAQAAIELAGIIESLNDSWRGDAAEAAKRELNVLEKISGKVGEDNLTPAKTSLGDQSESHTGTRHKLVDMPPAPEDANAIAEFFGISSQEENNEEWARKNRQNISTYSTYQTQTFANNAPLQKEFPEIPTSSGKEGGDEGDDRKGGGGGTWNSPAGTGGTTTSSYTGGGGGGGGGGGTTVPSTTLPSGGIGLPEGGVRLPDGSIRMPDGSIRKPDGTIVRPDGTIIRPDGTIIRPDGTIIPPGSTSASGHGSGGRDSAASFVPTGGAGGFGPGGGGPAGFGPTGGGAAAGAGAGLGAGKGVGSMAGAGAGAGAGGMGKGMGGAMGGRGGMGGMMGGAGAGGRGQGDEEKEHKDQYFIKQEMDPGLHVEHDEHGEKLVDETTGFTVVPPVIGE